MDQAYTSVKNTSFDPGHISIRWFEDGTLNLAANCLDRHLAERGDQTAIIWEGDDPTQSAKVTYKQLHHDVCQFANVLKKLGVKKGDVVAIYMPMVPGGRRRHAGLCAHWRRALGESLGAFPPEARSGPYYRFQLQTGESPLMKGCVLAARYR
ncbi:Acetyl-coenzyme A synthetase [Serratia fonticola]|uniref:Acetyl-coenzyme A synthetase n=1 Tax=Serratia fonticola TaxID=47917 RepID=A0A4U9TF98_SERFO|nr:Acetyl-coenzyme A synthetase [Serratia fonticola]